MKKGIEIGWHRGFVSWRIGHVLYQSIVFTWDLPKAKIQAEAHRGPVVAGGPAVALLGAPWADEAWRFGWPPHYSDPLAYHNPLATFTTRGCPNRCPFCAVPRIEGEFRELDRWKIAPLICDNNLLAASSLHFKSVINSLVGLPWVDFNQGLDAALFRPWHAQEIARLNNVHVRFSLDSSADIEQVKLAVDYSRAAGLKHISIYVLYGYNDTPVDAVRRLDLVESWNCFPVPMRYQPLDRMEKNTHVAPGWTENLLRQVNKRYRLIFYKGIPFSEFKRGQKDQPDLFGAADA